MEAVGQSRKMNVLYFTKIIAGGNPDYIKHIMVTHYIAKFYLSLLWGFTVVITGKPFLYYKNKRGVVIMTEFLEQLSVGKRGETLVKNALAARGHSIEDLSGSREY